MNVKTMEINSNSDEEAKKSAAFVNRMERLQRSEHEIEQTLTVEQTIHFGKRVKHMTKSSTVTAHQTSE